MARSHNLGGKRRRQIQKVLVERDGLVCFYCRQELVFCEQGEQPDRTTRRVATIEHLKARGDGGSNRLQNLVLACRPCQRERHE